MAHCDAESYERCSSHHPCVRLGGGVPAALHFCVVYPETAANFGCKSARYFRILGRPVRLDCPSRLGDLQIQVYTKVSTKGYKGYQLKGGFLYRTVVRESGDDGPETDEGVISSAD
jgi:hypothetical protein